MGLRFLLNGDPVLLENVAAEDTLLDFLRYRRRLTGSKEGCAEGDCGACTVLVGTLDGERPEHFRQKQEPVLRPEMRQIKEPEHCSGAAGSSNALVWRAVNACILLMPMLHGKAVLTVEGLSCDGTPNPLQRLMASNGSSQCGFCTPGFVMSLQGQAMGAVGSDLPVADVLAGNLCRCTGYGPIIAAAEANVARKDKCPPAAPAGGRGEERIVEALRDIRDGGALAGGSSEAPWFVPRTSDALAELLVQYPDARLVAGATDVGLWVTKRLARLGTAIFLGDIAELDSCEETSEGLTIGAGLRYADAHAALARLHPELGELIRRLGGLQVRNSGTIGGNIANGSPIGDGPPALIALGATLVLRSAAGRRVMPLEDYFLAYGRQDRRPGEFVESIGVPRPGQDALVQIAKLSRRFDSDISAVCGAFKLTILEGRIAAARIAFGGMAATPCRAPACEAALTGQPLDADTIASAAAALAEDYTPLTDVRGSAEYRLKAAQGLLRRLWHRAQGHAVSVLEEA